MTIKKISVFCGAHLGKSPDYQIAAEQIGKMMAEKDLEVIFGGGNVGLMKVVADTAVENGGRAIGITLKSLHEFELTNPNIDETIITHSLFERKEKFLDMSDAFIVLPGGVGSMDELLEVMVSNQLGGINKPVGLLNINGYYDGFLSWLQHSVDEEFVSIENQNQIAWFLEQEEGAAFVLEKEEILFSHQTQFDGFYAARLIRKVVNNIPKTV